MSTHGSRRSINSRTSSVSSEASLRAAEAKAKLATTRVRLEFLKKESELRKQILDTETQLSLLQEEKNLEAARVEADVFEALIVSECEGEETERQPVVQDEAQSSCERTWTYVHSLPHNDTETNLNPNAPEFVMDNNERTTSELSKYLLKKDLLLSRFTKFDDKPENYPSWKCSFTHILYELDVSASEELDLLVKYLGPTSSKHAVSVRSSSFGNPRWGVDQLWKRLNDRYGAPEIVEAALKRRLDDLPKITNDWTNLYSLADLLGEIRANMQVADYRDLLFYYNTSQGVIPIVNKLPYSLQEKWTARAARFKKDQHATHPPFSFFCDFIDEMCRVKNDPCFKYETKAPKDRASTSVAQKGKLSSLKTEVTSKNDGNLSDIALPSTSSTCPYHNVTGHNLSNCRTFRSKPLAVRKKFIKDKNLCFKCCNDYHKASSCTKVVMCEVCNESHPTALHVNKMADGGERGFAPEQKRDVVNSACSQVCGKVPGGKSCAKIVQAKVYHKDNPNLKVTMYCLIDDQSNRSLVKADFFDNFSCPFDVVPYSLSSCSGTIDATGRRASGFVAETMDGSASFELPPLTECNQIPDLFDEIPTPDTALAYPHLKPIAQQIPQPNRDLSILLLVGRDIGELHHVHEQRIGLKNEPFAQRLGLGWVIVGETCLGRVHKPDSIVANVTYVHSKGRVSIFPPCESQLVLKELANQSTELSAGGDLFQLTPSEEQLGTKIEDRQFLEIMSEQVAKTTEDNPADTGTREITRPSELQNSNWSRGPDFLHSSFSAVTNQEYALQDPATDKEVRCLKVETPDKTLIINQFTGIRSWNSLVGVIACLKTKARALKNESAESTEMQSASETFIIKQVQEEMFEEEIKRLNTGYRLPKNSPLAGLNPYLDDHGVVRVGGRLRNAHLSISETHPVILPKRHFVSQLIVSHYHAKIKHQGCHFTEGAIRKAGFWILGGKRIVRSLIHSCVKCRKLRGQPSHQIMADLPEDRVTPGAPFSSVGVDVFGPWNVVSRRTRGGVSHNKRWAVLYTCLKTRAIHIELIEEMSASSFINATRRFVALRGEVTEFRSDRGTNFVGAVDCMQCSSINVEDRQIKDFLASTRAAWKFNPPQASHMGGVWERLIGVVRRILEAILSDWSQDLTQEVLSTFMAEVCCIVNSRPLVPVPTDAANPSILSPMMLLTQKPAPVDIPLETNVKDMYKAMWRRVKCLSDMFWKRWRTEYLQTLQQRRKWKSAQRDVCVGDVVLMVEDDTPRTSWPMGMVTDVFPSADGRVRKVAVKVHRRGDSQSKVFTRPVTRLVTLIECEDQCN